MRDGDLVGGRDFGHFDQVTFLILRFKRSLGERVAASAECGVRGAQRCDVKAPQSAQTGR